MQILFASASHYARSCGFEDLYKFRKLYIFTRTITDAHGRHGGLYYTIFACPHGFLENAPKGHEEPSPGQTEPKAEWHPG